MNRLLTILLALCAVATATEAPRRGAWVTKAKWERRGGRVRSREVVAGRPRVLLRATDSDIQIEFRDTYQAVVETINGGKRFKTQRGWLEWIDADNLRPFEVAAEGDKGKLGHLAEFGAHFTRLRLTALPPSLTWKHKIICPAGTQFIYQPALTPAEKAPPLNAFRPAAIVGSYAVRDADNLKIAHVMRPRAKGAAGKSAWGVIAIERGPPLGDRETWLSTVTFPRLKLQQLTLPVRLIGLDTFGFGTPGGSYHFNMGDWVVATGTYSPAADGTVDNVWNYVQTDAGTNAATCGLWDDNSNPDDRVDDTAEITITTTAGWRGGAADAGAAIYSATSYWLGFHQKSDGVSVRWYFDNGTALLRYRNTATYSPGVVPDPFGTPSHSFSNFDKSSYITFTPSAAGGVPWYMHLNRQWRK